MQKSTMSLLLPPLYSKSHASFIDRDNGILIIKILICCVSIVKTIYILTNSMVCADEMCTRGCYRELTEEQNLGYEEEHLAIIDTINAEQSAAFNEILHHVIKGKGRVIFVDGPGETGKTYVYKALLAKVRSMDLISICRQCICVSNFIWTCKQTSPLS
jgi:hypothetical protein